MISSRGVEHGIAAIAIEKSIVYGEGMLPVSEFSVVTLSCNDLLLVVCSPTEVG